jgi:5-methylcytosine-specific restriction enzyme subunit McrC
MEMKPDPNRFVVFEHQSLIEGNKYGGSEFTAVQHQRLRDFYKEKDFPFYTLTGHGVRFCQYVGVLQIGNLTIEILPKADKFKSADTWKRLLIGMLKEVGLFKIHAPSSSALTLKSNSILDLYLDLYLTEIEYLLHRGLVKRYRKTEGNTTALKGNLQFSKHIQQNLVHQERFYVNYTTYDAQHSIHAILYKALRLVKQINTKNALHSRIGALLLNFPEMPDVKVSEATFDRITYNRKDEHYQTALEIARLLLLNYHPDVSKGRNNVLALLFDMNLLWEQFVYVTLKKQSKKDHVHYTISPQIEADFWRPQKGQMSKIKPDIVIEIDVQTRIVLDTKWKNLNGKNPTPEDLRQMYVYHDYFDAIKVALIYPSEGETQAKNGHFIDTKQNNLKNKACSIVSIATKSEINTWQAHIFDTINDWIKPKKNAS